MTPSLFAVMVKGIVSPLGKVGERRAEAVSEENKALVRREIEELFNHTGNLDVALKWHRLALFLGTQDIVASPSESQ